MKISTIISSILLAASFNTIASPLVIDQLSGFSTNITTESVLGETEVSSFFSIDEDVHIDAASWVGMIQHKTSTSIPETPDFIIRIYTDASNGPDNLLFEDKITPTYTDSAGVFSSSISFNLQAGNYWISFLGIEGENVSGYGAALEPGSLSTIFGSGGAIKSTPNSAWQPTNDGVSFYQARGFSFSLQGYPSAVPEPSSHIMLLLGFGLIIWLRKLNLIPASTKNWV